MKYLQHLVEILDFCFLVFFLWNFMFFKLNILCIKCLEKKVEIEIQNPLQNKCVESEKYLLFVVTNL